METSIDKENLWKQYNLHIDLYKHYLELLVKFNVFYYAVTGAIVSFYFSNVEIFLIKYSLIFPMVLSFSFGGFFVYSAILLEPVRDDLIAIRDALELYSVPEIKILKVALYLCATMFFVVAFSLSIIFFFPLQKAF